jgi:hypothetical protein
MTIDREQRIRDRREEYERTEADAAQTRALARLEQARKEQMAAEAAGYGAADDEPTPTR